MATEWLFGQRYNNLTTGAVRPCSSDEARARHAGGDEYAAVLRCEGRTVAAVEVETSSEAANVLFVDEHGRDWLTYLFKGSTQKSGLLFLAVSRHKEFEGEGKQLRSSEVLSFREDGSAYARYRDYVEETLREREGTKDDLSLHYEPVPKFGDYASLLREDRDRPVEDQRPDSPALLAAASRIV